LFIEPTIILVPQVHATKTILAVAAIIKKPRIDTVGGIVKIKTITCVIGEKNVVTIF
jgi:hypothetical protein